MSAKISIEYLPKLKTAERHVELLAGTPDAEMCIRLIHDQDDAAQAINLTGTLAHLWPKIEAAQAEGYGAFIVVNEGGHKTDDITRIRANFIDADDKEMPAEWHVQPSFIVRRNAMHWHAYWLVNGDEVPVETFTNRQKRFAKHYGSDPSVHDLPRVMRLAGTLHMKAALTPITIEDSGEEPWALIRSKVMRGIAKLEEPDIKPASVVSGKPVTEKHLRKLLSYLDPNMPREPWRNVVGAIHATPLVDDTDGSRRLEIAIAWSRGELDVTGLYDQVPPDRYTNDEAVEKCFRTMPPKEHGITFGTIDHLARAAGYEGPPAGSPSISERFGLVAKAEKKLEKRERFHIYTEDEMNNLPPPRWIVKDILQEHTTALWVGETQSYKSFMALELALAIATGTETFGVKPVQGPTVYAALEGLHDVMGQRRKAWRIMRGFEGKITDFYAMSAPTLGGDSEPDEFIDQIRQRCEARPDGRMPVLIVLETLNKILAGQNEDAASSASIVSNLCDRLVMEFGCSVILVHHKSDKVGAAEVRGSSGYRGNFDTYVGVEANRDSKTCKVKVHKHKTTAEPEPYHFQGGVFGPSLAFRLITAAEHQEQARKENPINRLAIGAILKAGGHVGAENGINTSTLARKLFPMQDGQETAEWVDLTDNVTKRLNERAEPGRELESYGHKKAGVRGATLWYLPAD